MVQKCRVVAQCVEGVKSHIQYIWQVIMPLKWWMVGERVEWVTRYSQYIGHIVMVLKCRMVGEYVEWVARQSQNRLGFIGTEK